MKNTIIYLIGFPGVGKLTTAKILCQKTGAIRVDNHMINNPIFSIIGADGVTPIPEAAWVRVRQIRDVVFDTIANLAPPEFSFVLTNVLLETESDRRWYEQVQKLAEQRNALFVPVVLKCSEAALVKRVCAPGRAENHKETSVDATLARLKKHKILSIAHPRMLELDTTDLEPDESADRIIAHINR